MSDPAPLAAPSSLPASGDDPAGAAIPAASSPEAPAPASDHDAGSEPHRSARREATRQRVLDAAREVFAEMGVIGGTVEDICERAGFTRGAFYSNFADKDDVVDALVEREHNRLLEHLDASFSEVDREVAAAGDIAAAASSIVDHLLRSVPIDRQLTLVQTELEIFAIRRPGQAGRFIEINDRFRRRVGAFIEEAMRRNGRELLVDPLVVTDTITAIAQASVRRGLLGGYGADVDALSVTVLPGFLLAFSRPVATP